MLIRRTLPALIAAVGAALVLLTPPRSEVIAQSAPEPTDTFLVRFGVDQSQPRSYDGSLRVEGGRVVSLDGWQFDTGDEFTSKNEWKCASLREEYWYAPWERNLEGTKRHEKLTEKGILIGLAMDGPGEVNIETLEGDFTFEPSQITWSTPREFLGGQALVSRAPGPRKAADDDAAEDYVSALRASDGTEWAAWQSYVNGGDQLWVRRNGEAPESLTAGESDLFQVKLAEGRDGRVWAIWSEQKDNNWDLFARTFQNGSWSSVERLTTHAETDIFHSLAADAKGRLYLAWQSPRSGQYDIYLRIHDGEKWGAETRVTDDPANDWEPAIAATGDGRAALLWDTYGKGDYDVRMRLINGGKLGEVVQVADTPSFEARPTALYGNDGRLWLAWEEGDAGWGKDYVSGIQEAGMGLLMRRQVRVAAYENGELRQLPGNPAAGLPAEARHVFLAPRLAQDGNGNPWVFYRFRTETPRRENPSTRAMWRSGASTFQNGRWSDLIEFPGGFGRIDAPLTAHRDGDGNLRVYWISDGRKFPEGFPQRQDLFTATLPSGPKQSREPELVKFEASLDAYQPVHLNEGADVARVRAYRAEVGGKNYRIVRGDMHRHTDISWDGNRDGSLFDCYRYALDAASHDYLGVADHNAGGDVEYNWWMIQKAADLFEVGGRFLPLYGYERSRSYPSGHRNVMFAQRGVPVFKFTQAEKDDNKNAGVEHLYEHLRKERGIVMVHTSATGAGSDWSDSDPEVETLVEIYQGYRRSYEHRGAPRSSLLDEKPAGYVWRAWEKGIKLGLQSSSDHVSTHASHGMIWVPEMSREAIIEGIRARRSYAATDNILVDYRLNGHFMGEAFSSSERPKVEAIIHGTGAIRKVEVIRNNEYIHTQPGGAAELKFSYVDNTAPRGENYYYIRVEQENGEIAWASPIWVTYR